MTRFGGRHFGRRAALVGAVACASAVAPGGALAAAGFTAPKRLTATHDGVELVDAVVAPNGRTAVVWREIDYGRRRKDDQFHYVVALGPDAAHLGTPRRLEAGEPFAGWAYSESVHALADGSMAVCFLSDARKGDVSAGCSFAPPTGDFGPLRTIARFPWQVRPTFTAYPRPDGRLVVVTSYRVPSQRRTFSARLVDPSGAMTPSQPLATLERDASIALAGADDGTIAATWVTGRALNSDGFILDDGTTQLSRMAPGTDQFVAPKAFTPEGATSPGIELVSGRRILVGYERTEGANPGRRYGVLESDGTLGPTKTFPRVSKKAGSYGPVRLLSDGTLFGTVQAFRENDSDCDMYPYSVVGAGPLVDASGTQPTAQLLSTPGQIAEYPQTAELADGTVLTAWGDSLDAGAHQRLEVAVRPPGSGRFAAPQVLPALSAGTFALAAGGDQALLVWKVSHGFTEPGRLVMSAFSPTGPAAPQAARPKHPESNCS